MLEDGAMLCAHITNNICSFGKRKLKVGQIIQRCHGINCLFSKYKSSCEGLNNCINYYICLTPSRVKPLRYKLTYCHRDIGNQCMHSYLVYQTSFIQSMKVLQCHYNEYDNYTQYDSQCLINLIGTFKIDVVCIWGHQ